MYTIKSFWILQHTGVHIVFSWNADTIAEIQLSNGKKFLKVYLKL